MGLLKAAYFRNRSIKVRRDIERSNQTSRDAELPGYSADPVRLSPVNSSPPAVTKTHVLLFISFVNFRSRSQTNHKTNVSLRGFNIELSRKINFPNNSRSRLSPADTQMLEMINVPRPGGWFTRVLWLQFK